MTDKTILLTGATGFVGKHVLLAALRTGYRVRASLRNPVGATRCGRRSFHTCPPARTLPCRS